jgi:hypothetical protein
MHIYKRLILILGIVNVAAIGQMPAPAVYDDSANRIMLNESYFSDEINYQLFQENIDQGLLNRDTVALRKLLNYKFSNFGTLLHISEILSTQYRFIDHHDSDMFKMHLFNVAGEAKYRHHLLEYYYKDFLSADSSIVSLFDPGPYDPIPYQIVSDERMSLLYRHIIFRNSDYIIRTSFRGDYNRLFHSMDAYLSYFNDCSVSEITKGKVYYQGSFCRNILNNSFKLSASSTLSGKYPTSNMTDFDLQSAWVEGANGLGIGEWITVNFDKTYMVAELIVFPGYGKSEELFYANGRLKEIKLRFGESSKTFTFADRFYAQSISINANISNLKIIVKDAYPGTKYEDVCISEIMFLGPEKGAK